MISAGEDGWTVERRGTRGVNEDRKGKKGHQTEEAGRERKTKDT